MHISFAIQTKCNNHVWLAERCCLLLAGILLSLPGKSPSSGLWLEQKKSGISSRSIEKRSSGGKWCCGWGFLNMPFGLVAGCRVGLLSHTGINYMCEIPFVIIAKNWKHFELRISTWTEFIVKNSICGLVNFHGHKIPMKGGEPSITRSAYPGLFHL